MEDLVGVMLMERFGEWEVEVELEDMGQLHLLQVALVVEE